MAVELIMPAISPTMEYEAAEDGRVKRLIVLAGTENIPVGTVLALLEHADEVIPESQTVSDEAISAEKVSSGRREFA